MELVYLSNMAWIAQVDFQSRDLLVAVVAVGLGLNILYAVLSNNRRCYDLGSVKTMESTFGRFVTQIILCCVGGLCLLMGAYLVSQSSGHRKSASAESVNESEFPLVGLTSSSQ